jgi:small subunit ribosomal protein S6
VGNCTIYEVKDDYGYNFEERIVVPPLDPHLNFIKNRGVARWSRLDAWGPSPALVRDQREGRGHLREGRRHLHGLDLQATSLPSEVDRRSRPNKSILRTKVIRPETR